MTETVVPQQVSLGDLHASLSDPAAGRDDVPERVTSRFPDATRSRRAARTTGLFEPDSIHDNLTRTRLPGPASAATPPTRYGPRCSSTDGPTARSTT